MPNKFLAWVLFLSSCFTRLWLLAHMFHAWHFDTDADGENFHAFHRLTLPHDCFPGYFVTSVPFLGQRFGLTVLGSDWNLQELNATGYFAVLDNGDVVTTADLSSHLNEELRMSIFSHFDWNTWREDMVITIQNGSQMLQFSQQAYTGHVLEDIPPHSIVEGLEDLGATIAADVTAFVWYAIVSGPRELFELNQEYGCRPVLRTLSPLDFERESQFLVTILATTRNLTDEPALARIWISVDNVNDNSPRMEKPLYTASVQDESLEGQTVVQVSASDADGSRVEYRMEDCTDFGISANNGTVYLRKNGKELQYIRYKLIVYAVDEGGKRSDTSLVYVHAEGRQLQRDISARNDRTKREARALRVVEVEETKTGELVDLENNYYEVFAFKEPGPKQMEINAVTGSVQLRAGEKLDFESHPDIEFTIQITRVDDPLYLEEQQVKIRLLDVNDESPEFKNVPRPFLATVAANAAMGTSIYQLMAQDADQDGAVRYILESGGEDRFDVDPESGVVRTKGAQPFHFGKEYEIGVSAQDVNAKTLQKSPTHSLKVLVGERDPQFYEIQYVASIPETAGKQYGITEIKAFSHQGYPLTYELTTEAGSQSNEFAIDPSTGIVDLLRILDYEKDPQQYHLRVRAIENGRPLRASTVNLIINLVDMNDNFPTFPLSQYIVQGIAETVAIGTDIIQVTATDLDSVTNSQLTYSVNDNSFMVQTLNNIGYIKTAKRLDYDNVPNHTYNFTIVATDNGSPSHQGYAMVRVSVTNVNDEDPVFVQPVEVIQVSEDAPLNTVIHVIQAYDPDGDSIIYAFSGGRLLSGPFSIEPKSGILTLVGLLEKSKVSYRLNVTAVDNGGCCGGTTSRRSNGLLSIEVKDINNNAPKFVDCAHFNPVVMERENVGTIVIQVKAVDLDTGPNANITYSLVKSSDQSSDRFDIDPVTGIIKTANVFDREAQIGVTDYGVTVKAEDQGSQKLAGFCTFRIKIGDKNDNPPVFNLPHYTASIEERSVVGKRVKQVYATDRDAGNNAKVEYFLQEDPSGFFTIDQYTGWITIAKPMSGRSQVLVEVEARDKGVPPQSTFTRIEVEITELSNAYPQWVEDYSLVPVRISENVPVNTIIKRLKATSSVPDSVVHYVIQPGETPEQNGQPRSFYIRIDDITNEMILLTYRTLDFEALPQYVLTIKAANRATSSLHNDTRLIIDLIDENDEIPQFIGLDENGRYPGSVAENLEPGAEVITVTATDKDEFQEYRKIYYRIKEAGTDFSKFSINRHSGVIRTLVSFDRETKNEYYVTVIAEDGAPSVRPNHYPSGTPNQGEAEVQIKVTDTNDNVPYFKDRLYTVRVPENTDPGTIIISVTADDKDEENRLTYSITGGNTGNAFEVVPDLGEVKVRGHLDYESNTREYHLLYRVFDDKFTNTTIILVQVVDVNDNPPKFDNAIYNVTDVMEEERGISKNNPKYLLSVRATDPDTDRNSIIRYSLTGQFADEGTFFINDHTGEVYLTHSLDRDQTRGRPVWNFNVLAHDEMDEYQPSLTGYAEVRVMPKDINDNAPVFDRNRLVGKIPEHSRAGMTVLTVIATDADNGNNGSVTYSLKQVPMKGSQPLFSIDSHMGLISTLLNNALDRETQSEYFVIVQAKDRGSPPLSASSTVTILIDDINDHAPRFTQSVYRAIISESYPPGSSITSVSATDLDIGNNARLTYMLKEQDQEFFYMSNVEVTNSGVLKVFKSVDFDALSLPFFNVTVYVQDTDPAHISSATIEIEVTDFNDNPPLFVPNSKRITIYENVTIGTTLHRFTASDKDTGINKQFTFAIDKYTDPGRQFSIDSNGLVTTSKHLDREALPGHRIHILAIDKGSPPQTGTGTLIINLMDVNDNFPEFAIDYQPIVYENQPPGQTIIQISAVDGDAPSNGPPFEFWLPCGGGCPCHANPNCNDFSFKFLPEGGENGHGAGIVTSLRTFDREKRKEFYLPIIMKDSGHPPISGTNTLTIIIGDINDNRHFPGHKNVLVYNYKGEFENVPLGNVYAEDEDDWDVSSKSFAFINPREAERNFRLDHRTGMLETKGRLMEGSYELRVRVHDVIWKREVVSSVAIQVKDISDDAIFNSGSLRISGLTAEAFMSRSKTEPSPTDYGWGKYDLLRMTVAKKLDIPLSNVDIFTIMNHPTLPRTVDVRYSAREGSTSYFQSVKLNGVLALFRNELEVLLNAWKVVVPIDECLNKLCESNGCSNRLVTTSEPHLINTNDTSLLGVLTFIKTECRCAIERVGAGREDGSGEVDCLPNSCLNGGTCLQQGPHKFQCHCQEGFDGPRCQQTRHSFHGNGWAWFDPLTQCEQSHTSLEFVTLKENGLILYNGPMKELQDKEPEDFVILELRNGYPFLRINLGSGEAKLTVDGRDKQGYVRLEKLNDGLWHKVDVIRNGKYVRLVVDECENSKIVENENDQTSYEDRRACEAASETPGDDSYLSLTSPLQIGGRTVVNIPFPANVPQEGFNGCIKNLIHNGKLYDLHIGKVGESKDSEDGCQREDWSCRRREGSSSSKESTGRTTNCGIEGKCVGTFLDTHYCICNPGWTGRRCSVEAPVRDFRQHSFIQWDFKDKFYANLDKRGAHRTDIQLMFRTRREFGLLFKAQNAQKSEYIILEIHDYRLRFRYNLGCGEQQVALLKANVSDGVWHSARVHRIGQWVQLQLDSGEGINFNQSFGIPGGHLQIHVSQRSLFAGGEARFPSSRGPPLVDYDFENSCMRDIRFNGQWFPMDVTQNRESSAAEYLMRSQNVFDGCLSEVCHWPSGLRCAAGLQCIDLWRHAECRCPMGSKLVRLDLTESCENINECYESSSLCNYGSCHDTNQGYFCRCQSGYGGSHCTERQETPSVLVTNSAIITITICATLILLLVLVFIICGRFRRRSQMDSYTSGVDPFDDVRENIIHYDEEGVGEEDQNVYDINKLRKPIGTGCHGDGVVIRSKVVNRDVVLPYADDADLVTCVRQHLWKADHDPNAPPYDSVREYAYEGSGSLAGSLSSLDTAYEEEAIRKIQQQQIR